MHKLRKERDAGPLHSGITQRKIKMAAHFKISTQNIYTSLSAYCAVTARLFRPNFSSKLKFVLVNVEMTLFRKKHQLKLKYLATINSSKPLKIIHH